jgi:hypothetical protein
MSGLLRSYSFKEIIVRELPDGLKTENRKWQADCGNNHACGKTPANAVKELVLFMTCKNEATECWLP